MPDETKEAVGQDQATDTGADEKDSQAGTGQETDEKPAATDTGKEDAGKGEATEGDGAQKDTSKGQKDAKAPTEGSQKEDDDDGSEPEVRPRMSTKDFIIQRQQKKIAKLKGRTDGEGSEEAGEDDEISQEDEDLITKVVAKKFAPILDKSLQAEDEQEIQGFLKDNPDFKPFEVKARRFMQHPSRRQLPIKSIFYEVAGDQLLKIGADRKTKADEDAKHTQTGGGSNRAGEGEKKSVWDLTPEEFEAEQEKVRRQQP